jgi:hypothetical protein
MPNKDTAIAAEYTLEALIDHFIDSKTSCVLYNSFFPVPFLHLVLFCVFATGLTSVGDY